MGGKWKQNSLEMVFNYRNSEKGQEKTLLCLHQPLSLGPLGRIRHCIYSASQVGQTSVPVADHQPAEPAGDSSIETLGKNPFVFRALSPFLSVLRCPLPAAASDFTF